MNFTRLLVPFVVGLCTVILVGLLTSYFLMLLWNGCLVGAVNGVNAITWLQAWGIIIICGLLFKSSFSKG